MSALHEPKIDCHCHILDPVAFPYAVDTPYRPAGQEIATAAQIAHVFAAHNVRHALLVQPNSGYGEDNRCLLAIASVKMLENRAHAEVAIVQAALGGKVMGEAASFGNNSAMASTCM